MLDLKIQRDHRGRLVCTDKVVRSHGGQVLWSCKPTVASIDKCIGELHLSTVSAGASKIRAALLARASKK